MDGGGGGRAVLTGPIRTVAETGSTNADMLDLARGGAAEGLWLRAERQTGGRGRQGRAWVSPPGNFHGSTLVRLRAGDPPAATLALVAAVALEEVLDAYLSFPGEGRGPVARTDLAGRSTSSTPTSQPGSGLRRGSPRGELRIKWPNDLLLDGGKLSGILLERAEDAVVIGIGVNLAHHPTDLDRPATSLAAHGGASDPGDFAETLADAFARWLDIWRGGGIAPVRTRWLERAHPVGTALAARLPDGSALDGLYAGLDADGALLLRLADGTMRVIHAGDVFLI